jgi:hypothetical protein
VVTTEATEIEGQIMGDETMEEADGTTIDIFHLIEDTTIEGITTTMETITDIKIS